MRRDSQLLIDQFNAHHRQTQAKANNAAAWDSMGDILNGLDISSDDEALELLDTELDQEQCWRRAVQLQPERDSTWMKLAELYLLVDDVDSALEPLRTIAIRQPGNAEVLCSLGSCLVSAAEIAGDKSQWSAHDAYFEEALAVLRKAVRVDSKTAEDNDAQCLIDDIANSMKLRSEMKK